MTRTHNHEQWQQLPLPELEHGADDQDAADTAPIPTAAPKETP